MGRKRSRIKLPSDEYKKLCTRVHQRDNWKCRICGVRKDMHAHHIIFRSAGGDDAEYNLLTVCDYCHHGIHFTSDKPGQGVVLLPSVAYQPIDANQHVRWMFVNGWKPKRFK